MDLIDKKFGNWTVIGKIKKNKWNKRAVNCKCKCGNVREIEITHLKNNASKRCRECYFKERKEKAYDKTEYKKDWYQKNKIRLRKYKQKNPITRENAHIYHLKYKYKLEIEHYNSLLQEQNNSCAICKTIFKIDNKIKKKLFVDHNHDSGQIRGLLCQKCNSAIGLLQDSPEIIINAFNYLINNDKIYNEKTSTYRENY